MTLSTSTATAAALIAGSPGERASAAATAAFAATLPVHAVPDAEWQALAEAALEPNAFLLPEWLRAVDESARLRSDIDALIGRDANGRLLALLPVISAWRAWRVPLPILVSADPYSDIGTPLLDRQDPVRAATALLSSARRKGARALMLRHAMLEGPAMAALREALAEDGLDPTLLRAERRAFLAAVGDADAMLRAAVGAKKMKELGRQRRRLEDNGPLNLEVATTREGVRAAIETFLQLEAGGWKATRGTALAQHEGDLRFIRSAAPDLAERGQCTVFTLMSGADPVAAGIVLRHHDRAFWFKLGVEERFAKSSPGVQLAMDLAHHYCADESVALVDSTAAPGHPMIEPIWRERVAIGDAVLPLRAGDPFQPLVLKAITATLAARRRSIQLRNIVRKVKEPRK